MRAATDRERWCAHSQHPRAEGYWPGASRHGSHPLKELFDRGRPESPDVGWPCSRLHPSTEPRRQSAFGRRVRHPEPQPVAGVDAELRRHVDPASDRSAPHHAALLAAVQRREPASRLVGCRSCHAFVKESDREREKPSAGSRANAIRELHDNSQRLWTIAGVPAAAAGRAQRREPSSS